MVWEIVIGVVLVIGILTAVREARLKMTRKKQPLKTKATRMPRYLNE
jgi:hypothetical protein